mmetsp:Transcript_12484/g.31366  ORF Transcript_12484/g.31366 Transcript_12484/m.31366 type:complete len:222 (+) Transcript_12484:968-1633(+)
MMTRRLISSFMIWSTASSVKGYQYLIPRYILLSIPLPLSSSSSLVPCSIVSLTMGEPPPMDSYASRELGAREEAMRRAMKLWRGWRRLGRRMMSGSLKRLKRKSSTSSSFSGPPRFRNRIPTFCSPDFAFSMVSRLIVVVTLSNMFLNIPLLAGAVAAQTGPRYPRLPEEVCGERRPARVGMRRAPGAKASVVAEKPASRQRAARERRCACILSGRRRIAG